MADQLRNVVDVFVGAIACKCLLTALTCQPVAQTEDHIL
jgi:hypothetical protein